MFSSLGKNAFVYDEVYGSKPIGRNVLQSEKVLLSGVTNNLLKNQLYSFDFFNLKKKFLKKYKFFKDLNSFKTI